MKKLIISLAFVGACSSAQSAPATRPMTMASSGTAIGAADPASAVRGFMGAAKSIDLQAMGALWGDQQALARDQFSKDELQKRELVMARCLRHDNFNIVGDAPGLAGARSVVVQLSYGELTRSANMEVVRGPSERWYVHQIDLGALQDICMKRG